MGPKILMVQPNYKYRAISNNEEEIKSVEDAFAKSTLWGFQIVASDKNKYLIDISDFVIRDSKDPSREVVCKEVFKQLRDRHNNARPYNPGRGWNRLKDKDTLKI